MSRKGVDQSTLHSPNAWENADLGSQERNEKFLRLMGGVKQREHKGNIVIGDNSGVPHNISKPERARIDKDLEAQFSEGIDRRLTASGQHKGLGSGSRSTDFSQPFHMETEKQDAKKHYLSSFVPARNPDS